MKGRSHRSSLPDDDGVVALFPQHFHTLANVRNLRGADEDHLDGRLALSVRSGTKQLALTDGAVDLPAVGIAADANVERSETGLRGILNFRGEQDRASAGSERWLQAYELPQFFESSFAEELEECAGFSPGNDETVNLVELLRLPDEHDLRAELFEPAAVRIEITLQS